MTMQVPERILIDAKPYSLHSQPLYRLLTSRRTDISAPDGRSTCCVRRYVGTWEIVDGMLTLVTLCTHGKDELPLSEDMRAWFLRLVPTNSFPVQATWFNGRLRVPIGPMLVWGFHGRSSWYTRERVITCRHGRVVRDREVDTLAILKWAMRVRPGLKENLVRGGKSADPLDWIDDNDYEHLQGDWWPPDMTEAGPRPS